MALCPGYSDSNYYKSMVKSHLSYTVACNPTCSESSLTCLFPNFYHETNFFVPSTYRACSILVLKLKLKDGFLDIHIFYICGKCPTTVSVSMSTACIIISRIMDSLTHVSTLFTSTQKHFHCIVTYNMLLKECLSQH